MNDYNKLCLKSELLVRKIFRLYLEERNFQDIIPLLHGNIAWLGANEADFCKTYTEAIEFLQTREEVFMAKGKILEQCYETLPMGDDMCLVYGEVNFAETEESFVSIYRSVRFSMICLLEEKKMKLLHAHSSEVNSAQESKEIIDEKRINNYNLLLEKKLEERTGMLNEKSEELEGITRNICGGVQICKYDEEFTIKYISEGFTAMTGYTKEDINSLYDGKHLAIVYKADAPLFTKKIFDQLKRKDTFSLEYRIVCKNGKIIWILDKGVIIPNESEDKEVECILTDITVQKEQEEELRLSEKRYEIALQASDITMFEYNVQTGDLILFEETAKSYGVPKIIKNGVRTFIEKKIIEPSSASEYKRMYRQIHNGAPKAKCYVKSKNAKGEIHDYELNLTNIFDNDGKPIRAIGVRKNVSEMLLLQKEQEFGKNFAYGKILLFEGDITNNRMDHLYEEWNEVCGSIENRLFTDIIKEAAKEYIFPEHQEMIIQTLSLEYIKEVLEKNRTLITFAYKRKKQTENYIWYEATISIIKDYLSGDIKIRFYHKDINSLKMKEQRATEEKLLYESMIAKAKIAYEFNISKDLLMKGNEYWEDSLGIKKQNNYMKSIVEFSQKGIQKEDTDSFLAFFLKEKIIERFQKGEGRLIHQYRRKRENGEYYWAKATLHLFEEPETGDIKGFLYVEDIDDEKRKEMALHYSAEHDIMTGIYNKATTEQKISEYLNTPEGKSAEHAFMIIDVDYFKSVNDTFGHLYGDDVLKEIVVKIHSIFREQDIIGRVGGDEFCVFLKQINTKKIAENKAGEICRKVCKIYEKDGKNCSISASIGISFYKEHGITYKELYKYADEQLYKAKKNGRNRYEA